MKEVYGIFFLPGRVRIGQGYGYAGEVEDPDGTYGELIRLLDGTRTMDQLVEAMRGRLGAGDVADAVSALVDAGYVEDAGTPVPPGLTDSDLERYLPNINFFSTVADGNRSKYDFQMTLKQTRVVLFGLGGIGSNVATALAELGIGSLVAVDFDRVQLSNLNRQVLYSTPAVGRLKTDVAADRLREFNPSMQFTGIAARIASADDVRSILAEYSPDVVINLADRPNGYIDHWVNEVCVASRTPVLAAMITNAIGVAYSVVPGVTACYNCRVEAEFARSPQLTEEIGYVREHDFNTPNGALGPACMFLAYFLTYELLRHVFDLAPMVTRDANFEIDFVTFAQSRQPFPLGEGCDVCRDAVADVRARTRAAEVAS